LDVVGAHAAGLEARRGVKPQRPRGRAGFTSRHGPGWPDVLDVVGAHAAGLEARRGV